MFLPLGRKESKWQRNLDPKPTLGIITDIINKNYVGRALKSKLIYGGIGIILGKQSIVKTNW